MRFRPCIDIHNGQVKQIVGGTLSDQMDEAQENFTAGQDAAAFARMYRSDGLTGGHIIMLNAETSPYFGETQRQALEALRTYPGGMQIGGGIRADNAGIYLEAGASHVIITSYVFEGGHIRWDRLEQLARTVGRDKIVLDLSCRRTQSGYVIATDRWQKLTDEIVCAELIDKLRAYCDEFLIHGIDVEGRRSGFDTELVSLLANVPQTGTYERGQNSLSRMTYAGGIDTLETLRAFRECTCGRIDVTVGSALDIFGGDIPYRSLLDELH